MNKEILIASLINAGLSQAKDIRGASLEDVLALERELKRSLPAQYREFLLAIGRGAGNFLRGEDVFLPALKGMRREAEILLSENAEAPLGEDVYVFFMHQGYEFAYFHLSDGDDPPIYQYVEGQKAPAVVWNSFSIFLADMISQHEILMRSYEGLDRQ